MSVGSIVLSLKHCQSPELHKLAWLQRLCASLHRLCPSLDSTHLTSIFLAQGFFGQPMEALIVMRGRRRVYLLPWLDVRSCYLLKFLICTVFTRVVHQIRGRVSTTRRFCWYQTPPLRLVLYRTSSMSFVRVVSRTSVRVNHGKPLVRNRRRKFLPAEVPRADALMIDRQCGYCGSHQKSAAFWREMRTTQPTRSG